MTKDGSLALTLVPDSDNVRFAEAVRLVHICPYQLSTSALNGAITQRCTVADWAAAPRFHYPTCSSGPSALLCFGPETLQQPSPPR